MAVPMLTYASKNWTTNRSEKRKIETVEMKFLHSVAGYMLLNKKRSADIRSELKIFDLTERSKKKIVMNTF
jgi:glucan phosphoethanolaminetransferase (alkaline phosphatase superfamily)